METSLTVCYWRSSTVKRFSSSDEELAEINTDRCFEDCRTCSRWRVFVPSCIAWSSDSFRHELWMRFRLMLSSMSAAASEMILGNISETIRASYFKIYQKVALDSRYILTWNDVINYFRRQQIVQTCIFWVIFQSRFLDNGSTDSENVYSFANIDSRASFTLVQFKSAPSSSKL